MIYTVGDLQAKLDDISSRYVKVEIDGVLRGVVYKDDIEEWCSRKKPRARLRKVFFVGREYMVKIGINLYPASSEDLWEKVPKHSLEEEKERASAQFNKTKDVNHEVPLVSWDERTGILHIKENERDNSQNDKSITTVQRDASCIGFFGRIKRWLRGDVSYKK